MIFTYTDIKECVYLESTDEYEEHGVDFEYEVDDDRILTPLTEFVWRDYFNKQGDRKMILNGIEDFILAYELIETLADNYYDELREYFEEDAFESRE